IEPWRRIFVAGQDAKDIIGPSLSCLDNHRQIRWKGAIVCDAGRLVVRKWARDRIRGPGWSLEHLPLIVGLFVGDLVGGGDSLDLVLVVAEIGKVAKIEMLDRMAGGADLLVNLKAALRRSPVVGAEDAVERPLLARRRRGGFSTRGERRQRQ